MEVICAKGNHEFRDKIYQSWLLHKLIYPNGELDRFVHWCKSRRSLSIIDINHRWYQLIEIDKEKSCDFDLYLNDFPIVIDDDFYRLLSITIDSYRLLSILLIDKVFFSVTSISIGFRYQSILISGLNRLIFIISIDFRYRFLLYTYWEIHTKKLCRKFSYANGF